ncbi:hypothetical protein CAP35_03045 [Chitinophagaceae bacterium IBVUCB1]|nr:hypothetical protein CAP35_03045 [Chitinophagaceae bacterium IBVUCB1]
MDNIIEVTEIKSVVRQLNTAVLKFTAKPGTNILNITGLPTGTQVVSAWITEYNEELGMIAGHAIFYTKSVQLYSKGEKCRVIFEMGSYDRNLTAVVTMIFG